MSVESQTEVDDEDGLVRGVYVVALSDDSVAWSKCCLLHLLMGSDDKQEGYDDIRQYKDAIETNLLLPTENELVTVDIEPVH